MPEMYRGASASQNVPDRTIVEVNTPHQLKTEPITVPYAIPADRPIGRLFHTPTSPTHGSSVLFETNIECDGAPKVESNRKPHTGTPGKTDPHIPLTTSTVKVNPVGLTVASDKGEV